MVINWYASGSWVGRCVMVAAVALLAACGASEDPAQAATASAAAAGATRATTDTGIELATCLEAGAAPPSCPDFIKAAAVGAAGQCTEFGGALRPSTASTIKSLDVDGDGAAEYLFDFSENFYCDTAISLFSCGSLGCPTILYRQQGGAWAPIGTLTAADAPGLEVLPAPAGTGFATLRGGCAGQRPCDELTTYGWDGSGYSVSLLEVRGHVVELAPDGLWILTADTTVRATPTTDAALLDRYTAGTEFIFIGTVRGTDYVYVSPCNACQRGFVPAGVLRKYQGGQGGS